MRLQSLALSAHNRGLDTLQPFLCATPAVQLAAALALSANTDAKAAAKPFYMKESDW